MASTVRIGNPAKRRLKRLQESWHRVRGEPPTQEELLDRALSYLERHADDFLAEAAWRPLSPDEIAELRSKLQVRSGAPGRYDIDEVVYGDDATDAPAAGGGA